MLSKLFYTPVIKGRLEPSKKDLDATLAVLDSYWAKSTRGKWALESGQSTAPVVGGKELVDH